MILGRSTSLARKPIKTAWMMNRHGLAANQRSEFFELFLDFLE
jgi:hypothetical protein